LASQELSSPTALNVPLYFARRWLAVVWLVGLTPGVHWLWPSDSGFVATNTAAAAATLTWLILESVLRGKATAVAATGAVAGLVGVTPAAGFVTPLEPFIGSSSFLFLRH